MVSPDEIDLRSDTVTRPTAAMREAMAEAEVGNSAFGEDPTVSRLETMAARRLGQERALFLPSGTMGNQVALMVWASRLQDPLRGPSVIVEQDAHINQWESGGLARLSGAQPITLPSDRGAMDPARVEAAITGPEAYPIRPVTAAICLEDTHNVSGGAVVPEQNLRAIRRVADDHRVPIHLDGARLFNAAVASGVGADRLGGLADSVMVSLSKGLCCPIGSILAGSEPFIADALEARTLLGGAMRQAGIVAAAGVVALETMVDRLAQDHENAQHLARGLAKLEGIGLDPATVETNILYFDVAGTGLDADAFCQRAGKEGVHFDSATGGTVARAVTHNDVDRDDVEEALRVATAVVDGA